MLHWLSFSQTSTPKTKQTKQQQCYKDFLQFQKNKEQEIGRNSKLTCQFQTIKTITCSHRRSTDKNKNQ
jgi:hypothetical protein